MTCGYLKDSGCKDAGIGIGGSEAAFKCEVGKAGGEDDGGEEGMQAPSIASVSELVDVSSAHSVSVIRATALLMISVISTSVNRSRENTLYLY